MGARVYVKKNMINLDKFLLLVNHHPIHTHRDGHPDLVPVVDTVSTTWGWYCRYLCVAAQYHSCCTVCNVYWHHHRPDIVTGS